MWLERLFSIRGRRRYLLHHAQQPLMRTFYQTPLDVDVDFNQASMVVLDLETSGLNATQDEILSIGLINIDQGEIDLGSAWHQTIRPQKPLVEENVLIHQLTDSELAHAPHLQDVLPELISRLSGRVLVAHHSVVELSFIQQACQKLFKEDFYIPVIDTLVLAQKKLHKQHTVFAANSLRLANLRQQYELPRLKAHNALSDALATAELLLAQAAEMAGNKELPLRRLLKSRMG